MVAPDEGAPRGAATLFNRPDIYAPYTPLKAKSNTEKWPGGGGAFVQNLNDEKALPVETRQDFLEIFRRSGN